jgi:hypothetical protein
MSDPAVFYCERHPKTETRLRCTRCDAAICPDCLVPGAVGMLCPRCGKGGSVSIDVAWWRFGLVLLVGMACGALAVSALRMAGFFQLIVAPMVGGLLGDLVNRLTGRKRGARVEALVVSSIAGGALLWLWVGGGWVGLVANPLSFAFTALALLMAGGAALARVRL